MKIRRLSDLLRGLAVRAMGGFLLVGFLAEGQTAAAPVFEPSTQSSRNPEERSGLPPLLSRDREIALAESAGPPNVARQATIYVLERGGYKAVRQSDGGFTCLVSRDRPDTLEPICFDPEGTETVLPTILEAARLREVGLTPDQVKARIAKGYLSGQFRAPRRAGVAYMLSKENRVFNGESVISYPPHVMIYAPHLKNEDIGADMTNRWMPWVLAEGEPTAYIIVVVGGESPEARR